MITIFQIDPEHPVRIHTVPSNNSAAYWKLKFLLFPDVNSLGVYPFDSSFVSLAIELILTNQQSISAHNIDSRSLLSSALTGNNNETAQN